MTALNNRWEQDGQPVDGREGKAVRPTFAQLSATAVGGDPAAWTVFGIWGDPAVTGKPVRNDLRSAAPGDGAP